MTLTSSEPVIHHEGNAIFGYDGGNHFARKEGSVRGVSLLRAPTESDFRPPLLPEETSFAAVLSGKTVFSPEETSFFIYDDIR